MSSREAISVNTKRKLWASCAGYCQNPFCNRSLFLEVEEETVSIGNLAHIIGVSSSGPRSEHALAQYVEKNGVDNLIMLCLECHKMVDELEKKFGVEKLRHWKSEHARKVAGLFAIPKYTSERDLLIEIDRLLEENKVIFSTYGPFSSLATSGEAGDTHKVWRRRCLDTILPNNERIVRIIEKHKDSFGFPWDIYRGLLEFKVHSTSFRENCLFEEKINDYRTFPESFPRLIKKALKMPVDDDDGKGSEEIEYRHDTVRKLIEKFLGKHKRISSMEEISRGVLALERTNGTRLRVFVTHTYFFTEYSYERALAEDPNISAILCANPYSGYTQSAKERCLEDRVGLFTLGEFMGALNFEGDRFLNFLLNNDRDARINDLTKRLKKCELNGCKVYLYGSFLRKKVFRDIDLLLVYPDNIHVSDVDPLIGEMKKCLSEFADKLHIEPCSVREFPALRMSYDNRVRIY